LGIDLKTEEALRSLDAEIRNSSRPGSQAPHAPPALTFGRPGKQSVKPERTGCVLRRRVNSLPQFHEILPIQACGFRWNLPKTLAKTLAGRR
jgi:hypothetical protein